MRRVSLRTILLDDHFVRVGGPDGNVAWPAPDFPQFSVHANFVGNEIGFEHSNRPGIQRQREPLPLPRAFLGPQPVPFRQPRPFVQRGRRPRFRR